MNRTWKQSLMTLPGVGASILPKLACPFCWPAYAALLSSVGLGFLISTAYLLPITVAALIVAVAALGFRAKERRGYGPFLFAVPAAAVVVIGKFVLESHPMMYAGVSGLLAGSLWNV